MGFTFEAILTSVNINYVRISSLGIPSHATVDLVLQEVPAGAEPHQPDVGWPSGSSAPHGHVGRVARPSTANRRSARRRHGA